MAFKVRELADALAAQPDGNWLAVIGCGRRSSKAKTCGTGGTQPVRVDTIDHLIGIDETSSAEELAALKDALQALLNSLPESAGPGMGGQEGETG
jgi:hypothetical protein